MVYEPFNKNNGYCLETKPGFHRKSILSYIQWSPKYCASIIYSGHQNTVLQLFTVVTKILCFSYVQWSPKYCALVIYSCHQNTVLQLYTVVTKILCFSYIQWSATYCALVIYRRHQNTVEYNNNILSRDTDFWMFKCGS